MSCISNKNLQVKEKTFANLGAGNITIDITKDEFSIAICELNKRIPGRFKENPNDSTKQIEVGLEEALGYKILDAKLNSIEIAGTHKEEILKATTAKYVAQEEANAIVATAEGNFKATEFKAKGNEALNNTDINYLKELAKISGAMKVLERRATPGLTTLVEANSDKKTNLLIKD